MPDTYSNFSQLSQALIEGVDYRICEQRRTSSVIIVAPHGGHIEPTTSQIARTIASDAFNLYCFEAIKSQNATDLHVTSTKFDEPRFLKLIVRCDCAVSVHGLRAKRLDNADILVGGLDSTLQNAICQQLSGAGFRAVPITSGDYAGRDPRNLCNRTISKAGVQLEICRGLRDRLATEAEVLDRFAGAVRDAIQGSIRRRLT